MRFFAARLVTTYGAQTDVEVAVTRIDSAQGVALGFALRDAARAEHLRLGPPPAEMSRPGAFDLVGTVPLKDIVAQATQEIERMCIEAALGLTRNNRLAAADLLGISRQSFYEKLRRYDLLSWEEPGQGAGA
jgi:DNA-binding NtrC family response regulator